MKAQRTPTGLVMWTDGALPDGYSIVWFGRGAGLFMGIHATRPDGQLIRIEHPTADATYETEREAHDAVTAFLRAGLAVPTR